METLMENIYAVIAAALALGVTHLLCYLKNNPYWKKGEPLVKEILKDVKDYDLNRDEARRVVDHIDKLIKKDL